MKRIIGLVVCALVLVISNTAEARRNRGNYNSNYNGNYGASYSQPARVAPVASTPAVSAVQPAAATETAQAYTALRPVTADSSPNAATAQAAAATVTRADYSTRTAQGVANLMASYNRVQHFGGNPGFEGCGCGATPAAAYSICCYGNSGMATVDVGYARSSSGMWYCCRRYR